MAGRHTEAERAAIVAGLTDQERAVYDHLTRSAEWMGRGQIADKMRAFQNQIDPVLAALKAKGLIDEAPPSKRRPFGPMVRPAPLRLAVVGDWLKGGLADRGYADLASIQRDYPSVKSLADPADGAEAAKARADREAELEAAKLRQTEELAAQEAAREAERQERIAERAASQAAQGDAA